MLLRCVDAVSAHTVLAVALAAIRERHTQPADLRREVQELLPGGFSWRRGPMCVAHMHRLLDTGTKETGIR